MKSGINIKTSRNNKPILNLRNYFLACMIVGLCTIALPGYAADQDSDGIDDGLDNCRLVQNPAQRDTNADGYGNVCDPDLNNDGIVNFLDLGIMRSVLFTADPDADLNGDGAVNFVDLGTMRSMLFQAPGPSGLFPILPGGTLTVNVTDKSDGTALSGATVIVDHASDPRQVGTTTAAGTVSFTIPSGGPVTVTIGMSDYELVTFIDINAVTINVSMGVLNQLAFVQGTASNYTGPGFVQPAFLGTGDWWDGCPFPTCEDLDEGTAGFYKLGIELPNRQYAYSAFDFGSNPPNFTAVTGVGPLVDGETLTVDLNFPITPPSTTTTEGTITVPTSLGTIAEVIAFGLSELGDQGKLMVGFSLPGTAYSYPYTLTTFAFTGGTSDEIAALARGTAGGETFSIRRGVGFGGTGVDFTLIDIPTNLLPTGTCGGVAPTLSWTAVPGASFYVVGLEGIPSDWEVVIDGGSTSFALPDLTGTNIASLGLSSGVPVNWFVQAIVAQGYNFNTIDEDTARRILTDRSVSADVICTP